MLGGGGSGMLDIRIRRVASRVPVRGPSEKPNTSTWEVVGNLLYNAYIKSILPGFERSVQDASQSTDSAPPPASQ